MKLINLNGGHRDISTSSCTVFAEGGHKFLAFMNSVQAVPPPVQSLHIDFTLVLIFISQVEITRQNLRFYTLSVPLTSA